MAIKLSRVIKTSAFFYQLLLVYNCRRMTIEFNGIDFAGINCLMGLDPGVNSYISLYQHIAVLSFWLLLESDYFCSFILEKKLF